MTDATGTPRQPLVDRAVATVRAPTQMWSSTSGDAGDAAVDGVYHGDIRHLARLTLSCAESAVETLTCTPAGPSATVFTALLRGVDGRQPDPRVRLRRVRRVAAASVSETWTIASGRDEPVVAELMLDAAPEFADLQGVKAGTAAPAPFSLAQTEAGARATAGARWCELHADEAEVTVAEGRITARWRVEVPAHGAVSGTWTVLLHDPDLVVTASAPRSAARPETDDDRLGRWVRRAADDLDALMLALPGHPDDVFLAAGAPWFLTLFGRDAIWAARLLLPHRVELAASTLRVLARLQGTTDDPATAEQPGGILHELRSDEVVIPGEGVVLPPRYYGTIDATPLWVCLLADARRAGMPDAEVRALLPNLRAALQWMVSNVPADGFLSYIDHTGKGLANQGWKDSGDSIQWRDGRLAEGPIALCEVQGYAYQAAMAGADLLEAFGEPGGDLRVWAQALRGRFAAAFWVTTPEGRYPAIALDGQHRPVDSLTSNVGHLLGTGILDPSDEAALGDLLSGPTMSTGFGLRTLSTGAAGYWPLSYHGGSVWAHDTAIVARAMHLAGLRDQAVALAAGLVTAAAGFDSRMPELFAGDPLSQTPIPTPYPAACRPQAWSAAAAFTCASILRSPA